MILLFLQLQVWMQRRGLFAVWLAFQSFSLVKDVFSARIVIWKIQAPECPVRTLINAVCHLLIQLCILEDWCPFEFHHTSSVYATTLLR